MVVSQLFGEFGEGSRLMTPTTVVRGKGREARRPGYLLSRYQDQEERSAYFGRLLHYQAHRQRVHARPRHSHRMAAVKFLHRAVTTQAKAIKQAFGA